MTTILEEFTPVSGDRRIVRKLGGIFTEASHDESAPPEAFQHLPATLAEFCTKLPVKVEGRPLDFEQYRYLKPLYRQTQFDQGRRPKTIANGFLKWADYRSI